MSRALPWILLAAVGLFWLVWGRDRGLVEDVDRERARVAELERRLTALRDQVEAYQPGGPARDDGAPAAPPPAGEPAAPEAPADPGEPPPSAELLARTRLNLQAQAIVKGWLEALRAARDDAAARAAVVADVLAALDDGGGNPARALAALRALPGLRDQPLDLPDVRRRLGPHVSGDEPALRRAALYALEVLDPRPSDLEAWVEEARVADRTSAERTAQAVTKVAHGRIEGPAADAVLLLLRPGTRIEPAPVLRGLGGASWLDPRVEARVLEIVGRAAPETAESAWFLHFLAPRLDPKTDVMVDFLLDLASDADRAPLGTVLRALRTGLSDVQRRHVADTLMAYAENAETAYALSALVQALAEHAGAGHVERLRGLLKGDDVRQALGPTIERAIEAAKRRP